jgi:hypothetical protein
VSQQVRVFVANISTTSINKAFHLPSAAFSAEICVWASCFITWWAAAAPFLGHIFILRFVSWPLLGLRCSFQSFFLAGPGRGSPLGIGGGVGHGVGGAERGGEAGRGLRLPGWRALYMGGYSWWVSGVMWQDMN